MRYLRESQCDHRRADVESQMDETAGYFEGQMLVAMPQMSDPRFARSVIYLCAHSADGAMGLVVNKLIDSVTFPDLLRQLNIDTDAPDEPPPRSRPRVRPCGRSARCRSISDSRRIGSDRRRPAPVPRSAPRRKDIRP